MQQFKRFNVLCLAVMLAVVVGCATTGITTKPLAAKQQASIWMIVYNSTYDDTMAMAKNPKATQAQKDMAAKKKVILTQVFPLLKIYAGIADTGGTPSVADAQAINDLINQLAASTGGK